MSLNRIHPLVLCGAIVWLMSSRTNAVLICADYFNYPAGQKLTNQNGGYGWNGPWFVTSGSGISHIAPSGDNMIAAGSMGHPPLASSGNRLVMKASNRGYRFIDLDTSHRPELIPLLDSDKLGADGTVIWIGFLGALNAANPTPNLTSGGGWHLYNGIDPFNVTDGDKLNHEKIFVGDRNQDIHWSIENTALPANQQGPGYNNAHYDSTFAVSTTPDLVVMRIDFRPDNSGSGILPAGSERVRMWVNPPLCCDPTGVTAPASDTDAGSPPMRFKDFRFDIFQVGSISEQFDFDEMRIATRFIEVVPIPGDMNCDGAVNGADIAAFTMALTDTSVYAAEFPGCDIRRGDLNADFVVDLLDVQAFVQTLLN